MTGKRREEKEEDKVKLKHYVLADRFPNYPEFDPIQDFKPPPLPLGTPNSVNSQ